MWIRWAAFQGAYLAAAIIAIAAVTWLVSWRVLYTGLAGGDTLYHLHLANWVATTFPGMDWWYRWDGQGMPYREGYNLVPAWLAVAVSRLHGVSVQDGLMIVEYLVNPIGALGLFAFCAYRLKQPLVGIVAGTLYLVSPMTWYFLVDRGLFANQIGTALFMPFVIALDIFFVEWNKGRSGPKLRLAAAAALFVAALASWCSPAMMGALLLVVPAYALAVKGGWRRRGLWLLVVTPFVGAVFLMLSAFWALPLGQVLLDVGSRHPPATYADSIFNLWSPGQLLQLPSYDAASNDSRNSLPLIVWGPALLGLVCLIWEWRVRVFAFLVALAAVLLVSHLPYRVSFNIPFAWTLINQRVGTVLMEFLAPLLAGIGWVGLPPFLLALSMKRIKAPRAVAGAVPVAGALAGLLLLPVCALAAGHNDPSRPFNLPYGAYSSEFDSRDIWQRHPIDACVVDQTHNPGACADPVLRVAFSITDLRIACAPNGNVRADVSICKALALGWSQADDPLVAATEAWCVGRTDPICDSTYSSLGSQLQLGNWRQPRVGCIIQQCHIVPGALPNPFAQPPQRAVLDAHSANYLMAFHDATGGAQFYTYNFQLEPSPALDDYMKDQMLSTQGVQVKAELSAITGADAVMLSPDQAALASDYVALGWQRASPSGDTFVNPHPSGLAAEWAGGSTVLVVGRLSSDASNPYNQVFKQAAQGLIPFTSGWLVRSRSAYIDDYSDSELAGYSSLLLLGYQYRDASTAWKRLDKYVRNGGHLFVETGWQYSDPDWNLTSAYSLLPVDGLGWGALDPKADVSVEGVSHPAFGAFTYQGGGWGASSASHARTGAAALVSVGGKVVVARWSVGRGQVLWSGMNLLAHANVSQSSDENAFVARQFGWLLGTPVPAAPIDPVWVGNDQAQLALAYTPGSTAVLFKESIDPGWSAELRWPGGSRSVDIQPAEMDFMLVRLDSVPAGSTLIFHYGPTWRVYLSWAVSSLALLLLVVWVVAPSPYRFARIRVKGFTSLLWERVHWSADTD